MDLTVQTWEATQSWQARKTEIMFPWAAHQIAYDTWIYIIYKNGKGKYLINKDSL